MSMCRLPPVGLEAEHGSRRIDPALPPLLQLQYLGKACVQSSSYQFFFGIPRSTQWRVADGSGAGGGRLILACARHAFALAAGRSTAEAASGRPPDCVFLHWVARRHDEEAELAREERPPSRCSIYAIVQNYKKELTKCKTEDQKAAAKFIGVSELMKYSVRSMA
ncbi:hypothetical protein EJB05_31925, partial [Eragrostis curvula]